MGNGQQTPFLRFDFFFDDNVATTTYLAYIFAAINPHCPDRAFSGVRHFIFVDFSKCFKYSCKSLIVVLTDTCFCVEKKQKEEFSKQIKRR